MKLVVPGGSGHLGQLLTLYFEERSHEVVVLTRRGARHGRAVAWDGRSAGPWLAELDGADVVINLAGRSVNCRYTRANLEEMYESRVDSTRAIGCAIAQARRPPAVWLQMSTATIYAHRFDVPHDEMTGRIGGDEPDVPAYWRTSIDIARAWEQALEDAPTPHTRKVALRTAMVMSTHRGSVFDLLIRLSRLGLGGPMAGGHQYISWIHARDFVRAVEFLIERDDLSGAVNIAAPNPLPQREAMAILRKALGVRMGLPATRWMAEIGAVVLRTDTELVLKSRRVVPRRLMEAGFAFEFACWRDAATDLVDAMRQGGRQQ
jgi:uncharacterized protein (TIGR01777 family)